MSTCGACDRTRFERYAMSLKRYLATSTREAMAQVRRELGDDAVILSSKRVAGDRIEIVAAAPRAMESLVEETRTSRAAVMQTLAASRGRASADPRGTAGRREARGRRFGAASWRILPAIRTEAKCGTGGQCQPCAGSRRGDYDECRTGDAHAQFGRDVQRCRRHAGSRGR